MDYLARDSADLSTDLWNRIDNAVIGTLKQQLVTRKFLSICGPMGAGLTATFVDDVEKDEILEDGIGRIEGRRRVELPLLFSDFNILGRDLELAKNTGAAVDISPAIVAAKKSARREDDLLMLGNDTLGTEGLVNARGAGKIKKGDWSKGEVGYTDVAKAVTQLIDGNYLGRQALVVSTDMYLALQRLQTSVGMLEIDRIKKLIDDVYMYPGLPTGTAVLVCAEPEYIDIALGLDFSVGYVELVDFNHHFRIMETAALRIKDPGAIIVIS